MNLTDRETDAIVDYFKGDPRYVHIGATYITPRDREAPKKMEGILRRALKDQVTRAQ